MHRWVAVAWLVLACRPHGAIYDPPTVSLAARPSNAKIDEHRIELAFDGGQLEFTLVSHGDQVTQIAENRYAVPVMISYLIQPIENVGLDRPQTGAVLLPPASAPMARGSQVVIAELQRLVQGAPYRRQFDFRARFGDPRASPSTYAYRLPYPQGRAYSVLQGFHGVFSHRGSNEYAVDFDCPVATPALAARPGVVVATHAAAQGSGTTPEFLDYRRTNFVLVQHNDGTIGEYMHLAPSSIRVRPGDRVERGEQLALTGNTGFSSTPHLHFQVMTAAEDGISARSFSFQLAVGPGQAEQPVEGKRYAAWE